jgi:hypothetical protein
VQDSTQQYTSGNDQSLDEADGTLSKNFNVAAKNANHD